MNAQDANSSSMTSEHRFPWKWWLKDLPSVPQNGLKVFSCFACGGGSSMGYKLAGYTVLGNCEIDPKIAAVYKANLHPKHSFVMDVRDFLKLPDSEIPEELFNLDVLDGSPPCSVFSVAGKREEGWNKEKQFAEGQKFQRLDDLFFTFIDIAKRLQPKVVVAENVLGLLRGKARGYVNEILSGFDEAGYIVQIFKLNAGQMGVPQARGRVFFICRRKCLELPNISLSFNEKAIVFGKVREPHGRQFADKDGKIATLIKKRRRVDTCTKDLCRRLGVGGGRGSAWIYWDDSVCWTMIAGCECLRGCDGLYMTDGDIRNISTFPQDYDFHGKSPQFICGMSVPPIMMAHVAANVAEQFFGVDYGRN